MLLPGPDASGRSQAPPDGEPLLRPRGAWARSLADADPLGDSAFFADHEAAPVETAVAALTARLAQDVVTTATAHAAAAVRAGAALITQAAHSARRVQARLALTEVGRFLKVDQVGMAGSSAQP